MEKEKIGFEHLKNNENSAIDNFFSIKSNFWSFGIPSTASSSFLKEFYPPVNCTVLKRIPRKYTLMGSTFCDELGCGDTGNLSANIAEIVKNPFNEKRIVGGSSSGSALSAIHSVSFSICSDTGDSVRRPAAFCGLFGFKPSYGLISRYGLIPLSSSLDTVGIISKNIEKIDEIFKKIARVDEKDLITIQAHNKVKKKEYRGSRKIFVIKGIEEFLCKDFLIKYSECKKKLKKKFKIEEIEIPGEIKNRLKFCYFILNTTELFSHFNALNGITFGGGKREGNIIDERTELLGKEVKKRIITGSYFLQSSKSEILNRSKKVMEETNKWFSELVKEDDFFVFPSFSEPTPAISEWKIEYNNNHWSNNLLLISNLSGTPSITLPIDNTISGWFSLTINSSYGNDNNLIKMSKKVKKIIEN